MAKETKEKTDSLDPFIVIRSLSYTKERTVTRDNEKDYNIYLTNRAFCNFADTVLFANEMNMLYHLDPLLQHDFYLNALRSRKRFSKWPKKEKQEERAAIREYFQCGWSKVSEYMSILTEQQVKDIMKTVKDLSSLNTKE